MTRPSEIQTLLGIIDQAFDHRSWHGTNMKGSLRGITSAGALWRPAPGRHNIWEVVNHCTYWMEEVDRALLGENIFDVEAIEDWPEAGGSPVEWKTDLEKLVATHEKVGKRIWALKPKDLERKLDAQFGETYFGFTFRKMLNGISDHNIYHAGQISLLRRT